MKRIFLINALRDGTAPCIPSHYYKAGTRDFMLKLNPLHIPHLAILEIEMEEPKIKQTGSYAPSSACNGKILGADGLCPTPLDHNGVFLQEPIRIRQATAQGYIACPPGGGFDASYPTSKLRRGRVQDNGDVVGAITASADSHCVYEGKTIIGYTRDNKGNVQAYHNKEVAGTLHASSGQGGNTDQFVREQVIGSMQANAMHGSIDGVSPCLTEAMGMGGGQIPMIAQNGHGYNNGGVFIDASPTVTSSAFQDNNHLVESRYRIRKLTPTECLRLMGVSDSDIEKMKSVKLTQTLKSGKVKEKPMPKTQLYKMAGNSIVVDVLYHIFHQMFIAEPPKREIRQMTIFDYL